MIKIQGKKTGGLSLLFCTVYFASYLTRYNYSTVLAALITDLNVSKEVAGIAVTALFVCYGAGQPVVGWLGDHISPKNLISMGMLGAAVMNLLTAFQSNPWIIAVMWGINGFFQSMLWPPLLHIVAENMEGRDYRNTLLQITAAGYMGNIVLYLIAPTFISLAGWRSMLFYPALFILEVDIIWCKFIKEGGKMPATNSAMTADDEAKGESALPTGRLLLLSGLPLIMVSVAIQGFLRSGISTWMPVYISENFSVGTNLSILTAVVLPLFSILCAKISERVYVRCSNNEVLSSSVMFAGILASSLLLYCFFDNMFLSVLFMAVIYGCGAGVNNILIGYLPVRYGTYGRVSTISGIVNSAVYVGSAVSAYAFVAVAESLGWKPLVIIWSVIAGIGTLSCVINMKKWNRFIQVLN